MTLPLYLPILAIAIVSLGSCKKETTVEANRSVAHTKTGKGPGIQRCLKGVEIKCGMLSFTDQLHYQAVYGCLAAAYDDYQASLSEQYGNLEEDEFNEMADNAGLSVEQPLIDFEAALSFISWRHHYEASLAYFLDNGGDPELFTIPNRFGDPVAGTLHNKEGAVMIGGKISLVDKNSRGWAFCSCDMYMTYLTDPGSFEGFEGDGCTTPH